VIWRNECQRMPEGNERRHAKHGYERFGTRPGSGTRPPEEHPFAAERRSIRWPRDAPSLLDTGNENGEHGGGRLGPGAAVPQNTNSPCPPTGRQLARNPVVRFRR